MAKSGQSGGVNISGYIGSIAGDVVGGDKGTKSASSFNMISGALGPLESAIEASSPEKHDEAKATLKQITYELGKGEKRDDRLVAKLLDGLVGLVPTAATAIVSAFGTPVLAALTGPVTSFVLDRLRGDDVTTA